MQTQTDSPRITAVSREAAATVDFELALDLQDPALTDFDDCIRAAAALVGGEFLFEMPSDGSMDDASRIAAVRLFHEEQEDEILFAVLNADGDQIRVPDRQEIADRFAGFARAFVGVLTRIREELPFGIGENGADA